MLLGQVKVHVEVCGRCWIEFLDGLSNHEKHFELLRVQVICSLRLFIP